MDDVNGAPSSPATSTRPRSKSSFTRAELMANSARCYVSTPAKPHRISLTPALSDSLVASRTRKEPVYSVVVRRGQPRPNPSHRPSNPGSDTHKPAIASISRRPHLSPGDSNLSRHGTLLTASGTPSRTAAELKSILGNHHARLKPKAALVRVGLGSATFNEHVTLEQAKSRARVEVDILPQTNVCVQGGYLSGRVKIYVRERTRKEDPVAVTGGKIRVIGFESRGDKSRSIFYQCSAMLSSVTPSLEGLYASEFDEEGFADAREGEHDFPFALYLSLSTENGQAKGPFRGPSGTSLNYIAMISLKIRDGSGRRSIAHFYRACEIWPRLDPTTMLSSALRPLQATVSTTPSKNPDDGRIKLTASLHRLHWVAGQLCRVKVVVGNDTNRTLREFTLSLHRSTTNFPHQLGGLNTGASDADPRQVSIITKQIAESTLRMGQPGMKGYASAKGWWTGVRPGQLSEFEHTILIPVDALTISRGCLFEVEYSLQVSMDSGSRLGADIQAMLPIRIIGFLSIDPPPSHPVNSRPQSPHSSRPVYLRRSTRATTTNVASPSVYSDPNKPRRTIIETSGARRSPSANTEIEPVSNIREEEADEADRSYRGSPYCQTGTGQCSDLEAAELGNLPLTDDTDEVVQHAIRTARTDPVYAGFSDLYYASQDQDLDEAVDSSETDSNEHLTDASERVDEDSFSSSSKKLVKGAVTRNEHESDSRARSSPRAHRYSSFAARVEEKTRLATVAYLNEGRPEQHKNDRPRLSLQISSVLGGEQGHGSSRDVEQAQTCIPSTISAVPEEDVPGQAPPMQGGHNGERSPPGARRTWTALASIPTPQSAYSSLFPAQTISTSLFSEGHQETSMPDPLCCHCGKRYMQSPADATISASPSTGLQQQQEYLANTHSDVNSDPSQPRGGVAGPRKLVDPRRASSANLSDVLTPVSASSTTSHVSTASIGSVSVKDKVRELEERVKAAALT